jgi:N-acetylglucosamine kinase-like BadF-type ATPase
MSARHRFTSRSTAVLTAALIALTALPAMASARPYYDGPGYKLAVPAETGSPAPTVVRTVVKQDAVRALPIALAGAAMIIAIAGTGYAMIRIAPLRQQLRGQH